MVSHRRTSESSKNDGFIITVFFISKIREVKKERSNMEEVTMKTIYGELKELRNQLAVIRYALIPEEEVSAEEIEEILRIDKEMEEGKRVKLEDV